MGNTQDRPIVGGRRRAASVVVGAVTELLVRVGQHRHALGDGGGWVRWIGLVLALAGLVVLVVSVVRVAGSLGEDRRSVRLLAMVGWAVVGAVAMAVVLVWL